MVLWSWFLQQWESKGNSPMPTTQTLLQMDLFQTLPFFDPPQTPIFFGSPLLVGGCVVVLGIPGSFCEPRCLEYCLFVFQEGLVFSCIPSIPGSSRYVKFVPLHQVVLVGFFLGEKAQLLHTWKIQVYCSVLNEQCSPHLQGEETLLNRFP